MSASYEDYEREYNAYLSKIRSFLAGTRNRSTLTECDRLLVEAKKCASAMQGLAQVENDQLRVQEARQKVERDIAPLATEIKRQLNEMGRQELFYQAPDIEQGSNTSDLDSLIRNSDDLLRESQSILAETEEIGTTTLHQMGRQREQLQNAHSSLEAVQNVALQAKNILTSMSRKALKNKLCLYLMIFVLAFLNLYVLYRIYLKHHHQKEPDHEP